MTIEINLSSFRLKIIITLVLVIATVSFISLFFYNNTLSKKIYKNAEKDIVSFLYLFRDQIISNHDGRTIRPNLEKLSNTSSVIGTYIFDDQGKIIYPEGLRSISHEDLDFSALSSTENDVVLRTYKEGDQHFSRASIRFPNQPSCYECHAQQKSILGYVVLDFSLHEYESTVDYTRNFSLFFTFLMVVLIIIFVMIMHYRFIKKSLADFKTTINMINQGNLYGRVRIPASKELGELGRSFNTMVDHFQTAQEKLQKYHEEELKDKQKLASIGEMSARLAHEIRNPVTGIANAIEIIIDETEDQQNKPVLEEIRRQANRVNKAISNLLNYSRAKELNMQEANINEIIQSVVFFLKNQLSHKTIQFDVGLDAKTPVFYFDPEKVENMMLNLGLNAIQAIEQVGKVEIRSTFDLQTNQVLISVKDDGQGIAPDKIDNIFNPFFTIRTEGTGLGLAIAREIVEMHHGEIQAINNPDKGCTFQIKLPVNQMN